MLSFVNDYCEVAHEIILAKLSEIQLNKNPGYGTDDICASAKAKIKKACGLDTADIHFLVGGTQTNQVVIDTMCQSYEGVIACTSGHVNIHEAGAIEFSGHKVLALPAHDGKLHAAEVDQYVEAFYADGSYDHMVFPGMVYISHPTELGTLYTKNELKELHEVCKKHNIPLFLDGARLGYALACTNQGLCDLTLKDIAELTDVFYIGGTKCGAMMGEAIVFTKNNTPKQFLTQVKQHGALLAKGFLLGVQFDTLFTNDLYEKIGANAIETASELRKILRAKNYPFFIESDTNQIMVVVENSKMEELKNHVVFGFWENVDEGHTAIRFCTSWGTSMEDVKALEAYL